MTGILCAALVTVAISAGFAAGAPVRHALTVTLDPTSRALRGVDRVTLPHGESGGFTLDRSFAVDRLEVDGTRQSAMERDGRVALALDDRDVHEVVIEYGGTVPAAPAEGSPTGPVAGPDGSYLPDAGWFPDFGGPVTYDVTIDVPDPQRAVTSGRLTAESTADGRYRATFVGDAPAGEPALFAGPWRIAERMHRGWRLRTYFHEQVADLADTYLEKTASYLDLYDGWIGGYPYPGFAVVSGPFPVGLGFAGLTYLGTQVVRLPFIPDTSLAHEVLHSWWGAAVRPGDDGNWAEGLTTFMADYMLRERAGGDAARQDRLGWLREFAVLPVAEDRPLAAFRGREHSASQATGYHKAAFVFEMLRDEIGPDAFTGGVRRFWNAHRFQAAGWADLEAAFAQASGVSLGGFFAQWVTRPGAPTLAVREVHRDGPRIAFTLTQTEPAYSLAVPVAIEAPDGTVVRTVHLHQPSSEHAIEVPGPAQAIVVDPDFRVFRRLAPDEIPPIIRGVAFDPRATTVVAARDAGTRAAALAVAAALFEREPSVRDATGELPAQPTLLVGTTGEVTAALAAAGLDPMPARLAGTGTARAWAMHRPDRRPLVVLAGDDAAALSAVARPLRHYGRESFVVFDGSRAIDRGLWVPAASGLRVEIRGDTGPADGTAPSPAS
jgi:aminopeptidase N